MKKDIYFSMLGIAAGELMISLGHVYIGLIIHIINLQAITITVIFRNIDSKYKDVLQSFLLILLLRMINLSMPKLFEMTLLSYSLVYSVMFLPIFSIIQAQNISYKEMGINLKKLHFYIPAALIIGTEMALIENKILHPAPLIVNPDFSEILLLTVVMFVFVGAVEELIFRSIILTRLEKALGTYQAILLSAALFGIMHAVYGIVNEVLFAAFFGLILGFLFKITRSFPLILVIHGTANVLLFGILPKIAGL